MTALPRPTTRQPSRRHFLRAATASLGTLATGLPGLVTAAQPRTWRMRLAFSSVMLGGLPIEEVCERAAKLGFEALDLWSAFDGCNHLPDVVQRLGPDGLKQLLAKNKLSLCSFSTYSTRWDRIGFPGYADFIAKFGGGVVVRGSEYLKPKPQTADPAAPPPPPLDLTASMRGFFERLKPEIEQAAQAKARLAIENHGHALLDSLDSFKAFVDLNPAPQHVGIAIAPYHLQGANASVDEAIRIAGSQLLFFYAWQRGEPLNQLPGIGPADFNPWIKALAEVNYQGYVNPFLHGHPTPEELSSALTKSRAYLESCAAKANA